VGEEPAQRKEGSSGDYYSFSEQSPSDFGMKKNILSNDVEVKGSIKFDEELIFDGKLEGEVQSEGTLILGENSDVQGEIRTRSVSLSGKVQGNITVEEKCELKGRAQLIGDLKAARLVIEEGATFVGRSEVTPNTVSMPRKQETARADGPKTGSAGN
jgi:cytoskeletal protein CcmA (bactofilin family)